MSNDPRHLLGRLGEQLAAEHLQRRGLHLLARNHRTRYGEIDLIAADASTLVFCEVKTRRVGTGSPWQSLDPRKRGRVRALALAWLAETTDRPRRRELRFDAIGIQLDHDDRLVVLDHVEGAF